MTDVLDGHRRLCYECLPQGICSWNYRISGPDHTGATRLEWLRGAGVLTLDGHDYGVRKDGRWEASWTVDLGDSQLIAHRLQLFARTFTLSTPVGEWTLAPSRVLGRNYSLERQGSVACVFRPMHLFTRRATIEVCPGTVDFPTMLFAFWLVAMNWRREQSG